MKVDHSNYVLKPFWLFCSFLIYFNCLFSFSQVRLPVKEKDSLVKTNSGKINTKLIRLNGNDGPYIINDTLYRVTTTNRLMAEVCFIRDSLVVRVDSIDEDEFYVNLRSNYSVPQSNYEASDKMIVISDIEGKYNAFAGFLIANKVIDENHNWIYDDGKLVLVGDFVDRGKNVTQVLWLIYKLEQQAKNVGGQVHFILGNHEVLNFQGDHRYNRGKYIKVAQEISGETNKAKAIKYLYSSTSELGKWLQTKNIIEKIGDYVFVHAGLSPEMLDYKLSLNKINTSVRENYTSVNKKRNDTIDFLYGSKGPFWYRGLVISNSKYQRITQTELDEILYYYDAKKIVIGHTVVDKISTDYSGKVIKIDVSHGNNKFSGKTKGILIENGIDYIVDDKGVKTKL